MYYPFICNFPYKINVFLSSSLSQSAKMFNYAGWRNACNYIFIVFAAIFIVTRLFVFPFRYTHILNLLFKWTATGCLFFYMLLIYHLPNQYFLCCSIIYCTWVYPVTVYEPFFGYYFFNGLLMILQCLHIFWAVLIIRIAVRFLTSNVNKHKELYRSVYLSTFQHSYHAQSNSITIKCIIYLLYYENNDYSRLRELRWTQWNCQLKVLKLKDSDFKSLKDHINPKYHLLEIH